MSSLKTVTANSEAKSPKALVTKVEAEKTDNPEAEQAFSAEDVMLLEKQEGVIASNVGAFLLIGEALSLIKERELQKITDSNFTFDEYCSKRWGFGKAYAYRLIASYACIKNLKTQMIPHGLTVFPVNEAQVRPLVPLSGEDQVHAWSAVVKKASGGFITAALVEAVVIGGSKKPSKSYRTSKVQVAAKAEHKKLMTITKLVDKALKVNTAKRTIKQLSGVLDAIQDLLAGD